MGLFSSILTNLLKDLIVDKYVNENKNNKPILKSIKVQDNIIHPTGETISYTVQFAVGRFLMHLFPNTFSTVEQAENYFLEFCNKAEKYNEDAELYNKKLWVNGFVDVDLLSNMKRYWNHDKKDHSYGITFKLFTPYNVKNELLKKEIQGLYDNNLEHLIKIKFLPKDIYKENSTSLTFHCVERIYITPLSISWFKWNNSFPSREYLSLPTNTLLKLLRINKTYDLEREERKELVKKFKKWHKKRDYKFQLNFKENSLTLENEFIRVDLDVEHIFPEEYDDFIYGYNVKDIDLF